MRQKSSVTVGRKSRLKLPDRWLLPLVMLAFTAPAVTFLGALANDKTRWLVSAVALAWAVVQGRVFQYLRAPAAFFAALFGVWAVSTVLWSEIPELSLMKGGAMLIIALGCAIAGHTWVRQRSATERFDYLMPLFCLVLLAGLGGLGNTESLEVSSHTRMYQGLVNGPNMFGSMLSMAAPLVAWNLFRYGKQPSRRKLWLIFAMLLAYFLMASASRAATASALCCFGGLVIAVPGRAQAKSISLIVVAAILAMAIPSVTQKIGGFLYKFNDTESVETGLFFTREGVWQESLFRAKMGGAVGGGFGVTIGESSFGGGMSAVGYGREKGSTVLAIMEETGIVGLCLYGCLMLALAVRICRAWFMVMPVDHRVTLGIAMGAVLGMTFQSVFEAWFVAPGSPESGCFWVLFGVALAVSDRNFIRSLNPSQSTQSAPRRGAAFRPSVMGDRRIPESTVLDTRLE